MGTIASVMDIARQALMADQEALNITSTNVANQNTAGYTREVVNFQSLDAVTLNGSTYGAGVMASQTSQRSRVLDQQVQQQTQTQAQAEALQTTLEQVQNIFGLTSTTSSASSTVLGTSIDSFFNALSTLTGNPSDSAARQSVIAAASNMAGAFNSAADQLTQILSHLNQQIVSDTNQVNSLIATVASLNGQIAGLNPSSDAGSLEDQRQLTITQLSQLVGLNQISTEQNGITLTTTNGAVLVSGERSYEMNTTQVGGTTHILAGVSGQDVTSTLSGGDVGGILEGRDQRLPSYANALDSLSYGIGTQINQVNEQGVDGAGNPGAALFSYSTGQSGAAASIEITTNDPNAVAAAATGEGSAGNANATLLANLADSAVVGNQTASSYFASFLSQVGSETSDVTISNSAQQATLTQLTAQRDSLSGVSLDEEAANLTQYQRSYQAASHVFTIADSIMASAINLGVQTSVS